MQFIPILSYVFRYGSHMSGGHLLRWRFGTWTKTLGGLLGGSLWGLAQGSRYRWSIAFDNDSQERVRLSHGAPRDKRKGCWNFQVFQGKHNSRELGEFINLKGGKLCFQIIVLQHFRLSVSSGRVGLVPSYFPSVSRALVENIWPREKVVNRMVLIRVKCAGFNRCDYI